MAERPRPRRVVRGERHRGLGITSGERTSRTRTSRPGPARRRPVDGPVFAADRRELRFWGSEPAGVVGCGSGRHQRVGCQVARAWRVPRGPRHDVEMASIDHTDAVPVTRAEIADGWGASETVADMALRRPRFRSVGPLQRTPVASTARVGVREAMALGLLPRAAARSA